MKKVLNLVLIISILCISCSYTSQKPQSGDPIKDEIQANNKVSFTYNSNIFLDGTINDTISVGVLFDTGAYALTMTDSLKQALQLKDSVTLKIGSWEYVFKDKKIWTSKSHTFGYIKRKTGKDGILLGWDFFEGKIIEISYKEPYLKELNDVSRLSDYNCIPYTINKGNLIIPVIIYIQGKKYTIDACIDTGLNESLVLNRVCL